MMVNAVLQTSFKRDDIRFINGEELKPPCEPNLYGGEVEGRTGGPRPGRSDQAGMTVPDDVTKNVIVGNQYASLKWKPVERTANPLYDLDKAKAAFNANKPLDEQSHRWRIHPLLPVPAMVLAGTSFIVEREETPDEARKRMDSDKSAQEANNYHSGILRAAENQRWVTAMDVAIGQTVTLDDPLWRDLLVRIADWRMDPNAFGRITQNKVYCDRLSTKDRDFIAACADYYQVGIFPGEAFVSMTMPSLVTSELTAKAAAAHQRAVDLEREAEIRFYQDQAGKSMVNLWNLR